MTENDKFAPTFFLLKLNMLTLDKKKIGKWWIYSNFPFYFM